MKITGVILWIVGILTLCVGAALILAQYSQKNSTKNDEQATAVVTGIEHSQYYSEENASEEDSYCAEFTFQSKEGQTISFKQGSISDSCTDPSDYTVGEQVPVYYDPHDPAGTATLAKGEDRFESFLVVMGSISICIAVPLLLVCVGLFVMDRVRSGRAAAASAQFTDFTK